MKIKLLIKLQESKKSPQNNSETNEEILRERFIPPEIRYKLIDDLRLKRENYWWSKISIIYNNMIMEYQKIINLLDDTMNQLSNFGIGNWVEINHESWGKYDSSNI